MANITMKSTKDSIFEAFQNQLKINEELKKTMSNPVKERETAVKNTVVAKSADLVAKSDDYVTGMKAACDKAAEEFSRLVSENQTLSSAIEIKKSEIADLYKIDEEMVDLTMIINAHNSMIKNCKEEFEAFQKAINEKKVSMENEQHQLVKYYDEQNIAYQTELKSKREKEAAEYAYITERTRQMQKDEWVDAFTATKKEQAEELAKKTVEFDEKEKFLIEKENELNAKQAYIDELEQKVNSIPDEIEKAKTNLQASLDDSYRKSHEKEVSFIEQKYKSEIELLKAKLEMSEKTVEEYAVKIEKLEGKVENAYSEIKDMASATIESAGNSRAYESLKGSFSAKQNS